MTEQTTIDDSGTDPPDNLCFYHDACGNIVPGENIMCSECLGLARHKDKLGAEQVGGHFKFISLVYRFYDEPPEVMEDLHSKGPDQFVEEISRWSDDS